MNDLLVTAKMGVWIEENEFKVIRDIGILIEEGRIVEVGKSSRIKQKLSGHDKLEVPHGAVTPGLYNSHSHAGLNMCRGLGDDTKLMDWLKNHIWPIEAKMTKNDVKIGTEMAALECIKYGTSAIASQYWHADIEAEVFKNAGVRALVGFPILDGREVGNERALFNKYHGKQGDIVRVAVCPHSLYTVTPEQFKKAEELRREFAEKEGAGKVVMHTHLAEAKLEGEEIREYLERIGEPDYLKKKWSTPTEYMEMVLGGLHPNLLLAHCIHLTEKDMDLLARAGSYSVLNPQSNLKLGSGIAKAAEMHKKGINLALGTDSVASNNSLDMFSAMKTQALITKGIASDPTVFPAKYIFHMATKEGARSMGWEAGGSLQEGSLADLMVVDLRSISLIPMWNDTDLVPHLVYSATGSDVHSHVIGGKIVMENREVQTLDEEKVKENMTNAVSHLKEKVYK